jgi:hypothetical protein
MFTGVKDNKNRGLSKQKQVLITNKLLFNEVFFLSVF